MKHLNKFNEAKVSDNDIFLRVKDIISVCEGSPKYQNKRAEDIVDNITYFSDGDYGKKERKVFIKMWNEKLDSKNRTHFYENEESEEVYWDTLLEDLKRDMGEFTNIKSSDFRYLSEWLKSKIVNKKIIN